MLSLLCACFDTGNAPDSATFHQSFELRRFLHFTRLDLHDVQEGNRYQPVVNGPGIIRRRHADRYRGTPYHRQFGMTHLIGPAVDQRQSERLKRLLLEELADIFGPHGFRPLEHPGMQLPRRGYSTAEKPAQSRGIAPFRVLASNAV